MTEPEIPLRIVLGDDSLLFREGVARVLRDAGCEVVGQTGTAEGLVRLVRETRPDVAIVDIRMPPAQRDEGLQAARQIREEHSGGSRSSCSPSTSTRRSRSGS